MSSVSEDQPVETPLGETPSGARSCPDVSLKRWQQLLVALSCATLLFGGQIRAITSPRSRMHLFWTHESALSYVVGILFLALIIYLFRILASRFRWAALVDHFFWLVVILSVPSLLFRTIPAAPYLFLIPFIPTMIVLGISFRRPSLGIIPKLEKGALLLSPLFLVLSFQLLNYQAWGGAPEVLSHRSSPRKAHPIFIFVFDEWSYKRSVQDGEFLPSLKNLRELSRQSFFFEKAHSLARNTWPSLEQFIYQISDELIILGDKTYWRKRNGSLTPTVEKESLFALAGTHGYNSALIGFHIPQRRILGDQVGYVDTQAFFYEPETFPGKVCRRIWRCFVFNVEWWIQSNSVRNDILKDMGRKVKSTKLDEKSYYRRLQEKAVFYLSTRVNEETSVRARDLVRHVEKESTLMIRNLPFNSILLSHIPIPHAPFIFNEQGEFLGPFQGLFMQIDLEGYLRQIGYLDTILKGYVGALVESGKFDEAMIIVTTDHSHKADPFEDDYQHVPLLIKLPHQTKAVRVKESFSLDSMKPVIDAVMAGRLDDARAGLMSAGEE